jgi:cell division protein FtsB
MDKNVKELGGLSRKAKVNIFIAVFIAFIVIAVFSSIRQISSIVANRERILELEQKLNYYRQENIKLLAEEKSLYDEQAIEAEARKQFNMTKGEETNYFVELTGQDESSGSSSTGSTESETSSGFSAQYTNKVYVESDLWQNIKILYENEIKE